MGDSSGLAVSIYAGQYTRSLVKVCYGKRFIPIFLHAARKRDLVVIRPDFQPAAAIRARLTWILNMSAETHRLTALRAGQAKRHPAVDRLSGQLEKDCQVKQLSARLQQLIEALSLYHRPGKTIEEKRSINPGEPSLDHLNYHIIWSQSSRPNDFLGLETERRAALGFGPQNCASRGSRNTKPFLYKIRLGSFSGSGRT
jgi:hypothetical protein